MGLLLRAGCCDCGGTTICVTTCGALPAYGVTIQLLSGGSVVASCVTSSSGCCFFAQSGTFTVQVLVGGTLEYSGTQTLSGGTITIPLGSNGGFVCCGTYAIPRTLTLTGPGGSTSFVYDAADSGRFGAPLWTGGYSVQAMSATVTTPGGSCVVAAPSNGPVRICYQMFCHSAQNPAFAIQRSWSWVYQPGSLTPIYFQDPTGFTPGQLCATAPPAICGNPLTDTASFAANPTTTSPFVLTGTPVDAGSNATVDPDAGSVTISA